MAVDPIFVDGEQLLITFLAGRPAVTAFAAANRIGTDLAAGQAATIRVSLVTTDLQEHWLAVQTINVECWGGTRAEARDLAFTVVAELAEIRSDHVSGYDVTLGPSYNPDPTSNRPRYLFDVDLMTHP